MVTQRQHDRALARVRAICASLPEVTERLSHGSPAWFVRGKKTIAMFVDDHHGDGILGIWCPAEPGVQEEMVALEPERFFRPPYVGPSGWLGVRLDREVDWDEVRGILTDSYRKVAPKTLVKQLETDSG
ncbi:MAG: MmcQ/YjbR family DNA-binding protein [Microthrixaceae bacterium]